MGCCQGSAVTPAHVPASAKSVSSVQEKVATQKPHHTAAPVEERVVYAFDFDEWRPENSDLPHLTAGRRKNGNVKPAPAANHDSTKESSDSPSPNGYNSPWVTVQCARGKPLVLKNGEWKIIEDQLSFHEWLLYVLWVQREKMAADINLRSETEEGRLVPYQVQVRSDEIVEFWEAIRGPWEEMKHAYRRTENHGGTVAPCLKWGITPKFVSERLSVDERERSQQCDIGSGCRRTASESRSDSDAASTTGSSLVGATVISTSTAASEAAYTTDDELYERNLGALHYVHPPSVPTGTMYTS